MVTDEPPSSLKDYFEFVKNESQKVYGWICGKCGRSNAPNVSQCPCSCHPTQLPPWQIDPPVTPGYYPPYTITWCHGGVGSSTCNTGFNDCGENIKFYG